MVTTSPSQLENFEYQPLVSPRAGARHRYRRFKRVAWVAFLLQFVGMAWWSEVLWSRYSVTNDGALQLQQFFLIGHGHLNAYNSIQNHAAIRDHFSLATWPLSLFDRIGPAGLNMLWLQDAALIAAEVVAFAWMCRVVKEARTPLDQRIESLILFAGLVILIANPWTYSSISFDVHLEPFAAPFALAAAYDFSQHRMRRAWIWVVCILLFGDVATTWVIGLGLSALIAAYFDRGRHFVRTALSLVIAGVVWLEFIGVLGANESSVLSNTFGYLVGPDPNVVPAHVTTSEVVKSVVVHPLRLLGRVWKNRLDLAANLAPTGVIGIFTPWTFGIPLAILLVNNSSGFDTDLFAVPGFQTAPVYPFAAVGLVIALCWFCGLRLPAVDVGSIRQWLWGGVASLVALSCVLWGIVWIPPLRTEWLRISAAQAAVLSKIESEIPAQDEVVASQGIVGRFGNRLQVADSFPGQSFPVVGHEVWFVLDPNSGIENVPVNGILGAIGQLAGPMHATLKVHADGIWAFAWHRPFRVHSVAAPSDPDAVPAWAVTDIAGAPAVSGPVSQWAAVTSGHQGYVISQDYWSRPAGNYDVRVTLSDISSLHLEVWDDNGDQLVARRFLTPYDGRETIDVPFTVNSSRPPEQPYAGWGPFHLDPIHPAPNQTLEIRIWSPAGGFAHVYSLSMHRMKGAR